ncbi:multiubiquitin domain-containing protein [Hydrogenophaga sp. OTU3427]|uniref:multiubiquitin domain-containing protein n=1 Tax=Hydrogenophaga sp. OTU3427 TaxID=3043856 RepID=UPI00313E1011
MNHTDTSNVERTAAIEVAGVDLRFRKIQMADRTPTGAQISAAAGFALNQQLTVLQLLPDGGFEDLRPDEVVQLVGGDKFIVIESDRSFRLTIDGRRVDWPVASISGEIVRKLGKVPDDKELYFEQQDVADRLLQNGDVIDLSGTGVESFYSRKATWVLNVQGVRLEVHTPAITVREALVMADFVPEDWDVYLKYESQQKVPVELSTVIELRTPGIEKLWLIPRDVGNGEVVQAVRQEFALQEEDEAFLNERYALWETFVEAGRRWLVIHALQVPTGYSGQRRVTLALEVPPNYPSAQIDMFYVFPALRLTTGAGIPNTEHHELIMGQSFQRWSRHRGQNAAWKADSDNVITHLALVESSLRKEVAQ